MNAVIKKMEALKRQCFEITDLCRRELRDPTQVEKEELQTLTSEWDLLDELASQGVGRKTEPDEPCGSGKPMSGPMSKGGDFGSALDRRQKLTDFGWCEQQITPQNELQHLDDNNFRNFGEYLLAIKQTKMGRFDSRLEALSQGEAVGSEGGFLLPAAFFAEVQMNGFSSEPWLALRRNFEIRSGDGNSLTIPILQDQDRSGDEVAGFALSRTSEASSLTDDQIVFGSTTMKLYKAAKLVKISNELLEDSAIDMSQTVADVFGRSIAMLQAKDFIQGTGSGQPLGIKNAGNLHVTTTSTSAGFLKNADVGNMISRLEPSSSPEKIAFIAHPSVMPILLEMVPNIANALTPSWAPSSVAGVPSDLFGFPLYFTDACDTSDTTGDIFLCDFSRYWYLGGTPVIDVSTDADFSTDQTTFRLKIRDNGQPWRGSTSTDRQGFSQANFVSLATRS